MGRRPNKRKQRKGALFDDVVEDNDPEPVAKTPIELDAMSVISDVRSKANNRSRHQAEFAAPPGVDPNGAKVFRSVANLTKVRRKQIVKSKKDTDKRAEKAIAVADRDERRVEKMAIKAALKQRWKKLWE